MLLKKVRFIAFITIGSIVLIFLALEGVGYSIGRKSALYWKSASTGKNNEIKELTYLQRKNNRLKRNIERLSPAAAYIVIDSANNILYLKKGLSVIRKVVVSCGSGNILEEPGGKRKWVFDTPRGMFEVKSKIRNPYWLKPDWAFIEEGEKIPKDLNERIESGALGDYALGFGDGYFIHGTLYTRLLGRNITHGCIRVGDADLKSLFTATSIGTKIFVF